MKRRPGIALITVMGLFVILSLLTVALIQGIAGYISTSERMIRRIKAHYLAEAGIHDAMMRMFIFHEPPSNSYSIYIDTPEGGKRVDITVDTSGGLPYTVTASANP